MEGYINIDIRKECNPDIILDLNNPLPFKDNTISEVIIDACLSYLDDVNSFFRELYRVCQNDAKVILSCPHYSYGFVDPNHKKGFSIGFYNFISEYNNIKINVESIKMNWLRSNNLHSFPVRAINQMISFTANLNRNLCERVWCYWVGGFEEVVFVFKFKK